MPAVLGFVPTPDLELQYNLTDFTKRYKPTPSTPEPPASPIPPPNTAPAPPSSAAPPGDLSQYLTDRTKPYKPTPSTPEPPPSTAPPTSSPVGGGNLGQYLTDTTKPLAPKPNAPSGGGAVVGGAAEVAGGGSLLATIGSAFALAFGFILATPSPTANDEDLMPPEPAKELEPPKYPFYGGQGTGLYNISFTFTFYGSPNSGTTTVWGPISQAGNLLYNGYSSVGCFCHGRANRYRREDIVLEGVFGTAGNNQKDIEITSINIKRADNQPDLDGNPPPLSHPTTTQIGQPTRTPQPQSPEKAPSSPTKTRVAPTPIPPPAIPQNPTSPTPTSTTGAPPTVAPIPELNPPVPTVPPPINPTADPITTPTPTTTPIPTGTPTILYGPSSNPGSIKIGPMEFRASSTPQNFTPTGPGGSPAPTTTPKPTTPTDPKPDDSEIEKFRKDLEQRLKPLGFIPAIANNTTPDALKDAAAAGTCQTTQPGGCTSKAVNNAADSVKDEVKKANQDLLSRLSDLASLDLLPQINAKLGDVKAIGSIGTGISNIVNHAGVSRLIDAITMVGVIHNALMLSNNLDDTLFQIIDNVVAIPTLIVNPQAETVNSQEVFGKATDEFFKGLLGVQTWEAVKTEWKTLNTICSTSAQALDNLRGIHSDSQDIMNTTSGWVAQLGNSLQNEGLIGEDNWNPKPEHPRFKSRSLAKLEGIANGIQAVDDGLQAIEMVTQNLRNIVDTANQIKENVSELDKAVGEGIKAAGEIRDKAIEALPDVSFTPEDLF